MLRSGRWRVVAAAAVVVTGCGGAARPASPASVVRAWSDTLRRGDIAGAARF